MQIFITFLEGIISFVSPCMLPMLPVYISYFASDGKGKRKTVADAVAFVCGFTAVFCVMGVFAGTIGSFLTRYSVTVNIVCGVVVIILGLSYLDIIPLPFFRGLKKGAKITGIFSAFVFGMVAYKRGEVKSILAPEETKKWTGHSSGYCGRFWPQTKICRKLPRWFESIITTD